jgi:glycerophosphoryl diester phosphodiesterase
MSVMNGSQKRFRITRYPFLDHDGPIAFAHRGGTAHGLENSMAAFGGAVSLGYRYLETDVRATLDGQLVAFHDPTLDRVTDRTGVVARLSWREVRLAMIGGVEPIALLGDVLEAWPHVRVNIDPKADSAVGPLIDLLRSRGAVDRVCVGSFSDERLRRVRSFLGPRLCTSMGPQEVARLRMAAWKLLPRAAVSQRAGCVQLPIRHGRVRLVEPRLLGTAHELGLPIHVWTINDPNEMRRLLDLGVDGLVSDEVAKLRAVLEERGLWR